MPGEQVYRVPTLSLPDPNKAQTAESLVDALREFRADDYDPATIRAHAAAFDATRFRDRLRAEAEWLVQEHATLAPLAEPRVVHPQPTDLAA